MRSDVGIAKHQVIYKKTVARVQRKCGLYTATLYSRESMLITKSMIG